MDPLTITRSIRIDADVDAVWASVGDIDGLAGWLGSRVDVDLVPGAAGSFVDHDGTSRRLVLTQFESGAGQRQVGFVWWEDERPDAASRVTIAVEHDGDGTRVTVTETVDPMGAAVGGSLGGRASAWSGADIGDVGGLDARWDARLGQLLGLTAPVLVGVGA